MMSELPFPLHYPPPSPSPLSTTLPIPTYHFPSSTNACCTSQVTETTTHSRQLSRLTLQPPHTATPKRRNPYTPQPCTRCNPSMPHPPHAATPTHHNSNMPQPQHAATPTCHDLTLINPTLVHPFTLPSPHSAIPSLPRGLLLQYWKRSAG